MKSLGLHAFLFAFFLSIGTPASATLLSLTDCDSQGCEGSDVFLNVESVSGGWDITLTLDSTGYFGSLDGVVQAGFKAVSGINNSDVTLDSFSDGSWSSAKVAGINGGGGALCDGSSSPDFVCTSGYANIETNQVYTWNFSVTGGTLLDVDSWAIKFQYCDEGDTDCRGHLISAHSAPVPEPSAALVFATGLLVASRKLGRRR